MSRAGEASLSAADFGETACAGRLGGWIGRPGEAEFRGEPAFGLTQKLPQFHRNAHIARDFELAQSDTCHGVQFSGQKLGQVVLRDADRAIRFWSCVDA